MIHEFVEHRHDVVIRRTKFELSEAEKRAHILEGYLIALDHLDEVIQLIRGSATPEEARVGLMERFGLSDIQARAILDMTLRRLTGLERDKIKDEYAELMKTIEYLKEILADEALRMRELSKTSCRKSRKNLGMNVVHKLCIQRKTCVWRTSLTTRRSLLQSLIIAM